MTERRRGWAIDRDYIETGLVGYGQVSAEQVKAEGEMVIGRMITVETDLKANELADPIRFRLRDDDGEIYYGGAISESWLTGDETLAFAALRWGEASAGCTSLEYRGEEGAWNVL